MAELQGPLHAGCGHGKTLEGARNRCRVDDASPDDHPVRKDGGALSFCVFGILPSPHSQENKAE